MIFQIEQSLGVIVKQLGIERKICWIMLAGLLSNVAHANDTAKQTSKHTVEPLTVMSWNVEWFYDEYAGDNYSRLGKEKSAPSREEWDWRRDAVAESIQRVKPTVLAFQEVENRRVLWYLSRALDRNYKLDYHEICFQSRDNFTEQDVAFMFRKPIDLTDASQFFYTQRLRKSKQYFDLTKHILGTFEFPTGDGNFETVVVMNIHWRSRPEGEPVRLRQARLTHLWIREWIQQGKNVILLGDTNSEEKGDTTRQVSDLGIACGLETPSPEDDLVDLHLRMSVDQRRTHLLPDKQFDRIMVSRSLIDDTPNKPDLVFSKIQVMPELSIRGNRDTQEEHWEQYWSLPQNERDLSDHYPVMATFEVR